MLDFARPYEKALNAQVPNGNFPTLKEIQVERSNLGLYSSSDTFFNPWLSMTKKVVVRLYKYIECREEFLKRGYYVDGSYYAWNIDTTFVVLLHCDKD